MQKEELYGRRVLINQALPAPFGLTGTLGYLPPV